MLPQRYEFSSKSQHIDVIVSVTSGCCCYRKGTNFQANHNQRKKRNSAATVVVATAKVRIFKQITTENGFSISWHGLLLLPQRYEFSSKSQLLSKTKPPFKSCCCYRKGTNFQANHNLVYIPQRRQELLLLPQRYEFSSKSQPKCMSLRMRHVVVATAKVRIFKQITTILGRCKN